MDGLPTYFCYLLQFIDHAYDRLCRSCPKIEWLLDQLISGQIEKVFAGDFLINDSLNVTIFQLVSFFVILEELVQLCAFPIFDLQIEGIGNDNVIGWL